MKRELTSSSGHMEGSHSPFGLAWQIASATGWSLHYIMWKIPYPTVLMMTMDSPRYVKGGKKKFTKRINATDYFQTKLD